MDVGATPEMTKEFQKHRQEIHGRMHRLIKAQVQQKLPFVNDRTANEVANAVTDAVRVHLADVFELGEH